jgi:outer membrane protein TolC
LISLKNLGKWPNQTWVLGLSVLLASLAAGMPSWGQQQTIGLAPPQAAGPTQQNYQGSVATGEATAGIIDLTLDDAIQRGLKTNLGVILSSAQSASARGQRLSQLQTLLPTVDATIQETEMQSDLAAQGLRFPGFPTIIGPFAYTDIRGTLKMSLVDVNSLRQYMAARHNFAASQLSAQDARDLVVLTVGNAYLLALADETEISTVQAQVATSKVSLDQAEANHQAGTAPLLDELRAKVDYQTLQQQLIVAQNSFEKDKLALARTIGLPLAQKFNLSEKAPYAAFDEVDVEATIKQAHANRKDLASLVETQKGAEQQRKAATADRYPTVKFSGDYGDIGVNVRHSHGTGDASGTLSVPLFDEFALRGEAETAQAQLDIAKANLSDKSAQVDADVRDALLDIEAAQKQVEVAKSTVDLSTEALKEAQDRYVNGVSDNLAVSQAEQSLTTANDTYVASLYRHNVAKLSLARALGAGQNYQVYLGGK